MVDREMSRSSLQNHNQDVDFSCIQDSQLSSSVWVGLMDILCCKTQRPVITSVGDW